MKRTNRYTTAIYIVLLVAFGIMAEGCHNSRKCGCGSDIMGVYKPGKRMRY